MKNKEDEMKGHMANYFLMECKSFVALNGDFKFDMKLELKDDYVYFMQKPFCSKSDFAELQNGLSQWVSRNNGCNGLNVIVATMKDFMDENGITVIENRNGMFDEYF